MSRITAILIHARLVAFHFLNGVPKLNQIRSTDCFQRRMSLKEKRARKDLSRLQLWLRNLLKALKKLSE